MYIRGLIPRNFAELAEVVPIVTPSDAELQAVFKASMQSVANRIKIDCYIVRHRVHESVYLSVNLISKPFNYFNVATCLGQIQYATHLYPNAMELFSMLI